MSSIYDLIPQEIISSVGWTLLHSLWQGAIISTILYITLYILKKRNANLNAVLSTIALLILVVASVVTFNLEYSAATRQVIEQAGLDASGNQHIITNSNGVAIDTEQKGILSKAYTEFQMFLRENISLIVTIWLAGLVIFTLRFLGGLFYLARVRRRISIVKDSVYNKSIENICRKINLKSRISLAESAYTMVPIVIGFIKPVILFPFGLLSGLPQEQIEAILAHEIAHLKRYDVVINLLQSIAEVIFFYNPFVWWISNKIRMEREYCCDDMAIKLCGNELVYAKALVNLESLIGNNLPLFAIPLFKNKNQLLRRIKRMLHKNENPNRFKEKFTAVIIFIGILITASVFKNVNATTASKGMTGINAGAQVLLPGLPSVPAMPSVIDTTISKRKGTSTMTFSRTENGEEIEYRAKLKDGKVVSLYRDDEKVAEKDLGKYKNMIEEIVRKHEADMAKHEQDMKKHEQDMEKHEQDMEKHEQDMKKHEQDMKKHEQDMRKQAEDMKKHKMDKQKYEIDMKKHEQDMEKHEQDMEKHEQDMKKHEQDMKKHEIEMKKHDAFMKDLKIMLVDEGIVKKGDNNFDLKLTSKKILVDGEKLSEDILNKTKKLYKKHYDKEMSGSNSITINNGGSSINIDDNE